MFDPSKSLKKMLGKGLNVPRMMTGTKSPSDWDGDGILNKFDCQPRNIFRQDAKPNKMMMERIKKLPVYYYEPLEERAYPVHSKYVNKDTRGKKAKQHIYKGFKKNPNLMSAIEKRNAMVLITNKRSVEIPNSKNNLTYEFLEDDEKAAGAYPVYNNISEGKDYKEGRILYKTNLAKPGILFHELKHVDQFEDKSLDQYNKDSIKEYEEYNTRFRNSPDNIQKYLGIPSEHEAELYREKKEALVTDKVYDESDAKELSEINMEKKMIIEPYDYQYDRIKNKEYKLGKKVEGKKNLSKQVFMEHLGDDQPIKEVYIEKEIIDQEKELEKERWEQEYLKKAIKDAEKEIGISFGASIDKQQEWQDKPEMEKDIDRITEPDIDGDNVPDEYDCQPTNPKEQEYAMVNSKGELDTDITEEYQLQKTIEGKKPVTIINKNYFDQDIRRNMNLKDLNYVEVIAPVDFDDVRKGETTEYIFYAKGHENDALKIKKMSEEGISIIAKGKKLPDEHHIELGKILGYDINEIKGFLGRNKIHNS